MIDKPSINGQVPTSQKRVIEDDFSERLVIYTVVKEVNCGLLYVIKTGTKVGGQREGFDYGYSQKKVIVIDTKVVINGPEDLGSRIYVSDEKVRLNELCYIRETASGVEITDSSLNEDL